ncbi:hypothetical protein C2G38_2033201 [Gigaspora rosea]|uniref:BACK domain-containing protein n=1 Tax=Gigaspora rosea TaxID=44941 RepID=A0A397VNL7_9GLOM|nr:hypothetical protein C2G38_2033201 [Gigaspora rosea]
MGVKVNTGVKICFVYCFSRVLTGRYIFINNQVETLSEVEIVNVLGAADELCLNVLVEVLQGILMERKHLWMDKQSVLIYNAGQKYPTCTLLSEIMQEALYQEPELLLKSDDFMSLEVETVNWLLQRDDLGMSELDLWRRLVEWGIGQFQTTLDLRWRHIPAVEFEKQVSIYKRLLPPELHDPDISGSQDNNRKRRSTRLEDEKSNMEELRSLIKEQTETIMEIMKNQYAQTSEFQQKQHDDQMDIFRQLLFKL